MSVRERLRPGPASLWRNRDFTLLWGSQSLSELGSSMTRLAYPLLVLALTGSPVLAGAVGTVALVVQTVVRIPAGVLVDRVDRRRLMIGCDVIRLALFVTLGVLVLVGHASLVAVLVVAVGESVCSAAFGTSEMSAVRNVVPIEDLPTAMARNEARGAAVGLVGPPLGGALYSVGRWVPFLGDALSYLCSLVGLLFIRGRFQAERAGPATSPLHDLAEGVRFTLAEPFLRAAMLIAAPINFVANGLIFAVILLLQRQGVAPALIGMVETVVALGALVGAVLAGAVVRRVRMATLVRAISCLGVPVLATMAPFTSSLLAAVPLGVLVLAAPALNASLFGYLARVTPDRLQGRVTSALITAATGVAALAPLVAGLLVRDVGGPGTVLIFVAVLVIPALVSLTSRGLRTADA